MCRVLFQISRCNPRVEGWKAEGVSCLACGLLGCLLSRPSLIRLVWERHSNLLFFAYKTISFVGGKFFQGVINKKQKKGPLWSVGKSSASPWGRRIRFLLLWAGQACLYKLEEPLSAGGLVPTQFPGPRWLLSSAHLLTDAALPRSEPRTSPEKS